MLLHYFCKSCTVYDLYHFFPDICNVLSFVYKKSKFPCFANDGCFKFNIKSPEACIAYQDENVLSKPI